MPPVEGRRWALVVLGPAGILIGIALIGYLGLFVAPGAPCAGADSVVPPSAEFAVASNGSGVTVIHVGNERVGGPTTDRIVVSVQNTESPDIVSREWIDSDGSLDPWDSLTIAADDIDFPLSKRDRVTVQWYGIDRGVAEVCPNGRTYSELESVRLENTSMVIETDG